MAFEGEPVRHGSPPGTTCPPDSAHWIETTRGILSYDTKLADGQQEHHLTSMVFAEIKPHIEMLPHAERVKAMAFLKHLLRAENPDYQRELAQRHTDIEAGRRITLTEATQRLDNP